MLIKNYRVKNAVFLKSSFYQNPSSLIWSFPSCWLARYILSLFCTRFISISLALLYSFHSHFTRWVALEKLCLECHSKNVFNMKFSKITKRYNISTRSLFSFRLRRYPINTYQVTYLYFVFGGLNTTTGWYGTEIRGFL
jgi:hypothetical protein